jgi:hypothetical protein
MEKITLNIIKDIVILHDEQNQLFEELLPIYKDFTVSERKTIYDAGNLGSFNQTVATIVACLMRRDIEVLDDNWKPMKKQYSHQILSLLNNPKS